MLAIIWDHICLLHPLNAIRPTFLTFSSYPGAILSWLFFVLAGYLTYQGYRTDKYRLTVRDTLRFWFNRAIRILPLFYFSTLTIWLGYLYAGVKEIPPFPGFMRSLFFLDFNFFHGINAISAAWFVGILIHFYLVAPFVVRGYRFVYERFGTQLTFCFLIAASAVCHLFSYLLRNGSGGKFDTRNIVGFLPLFLFGFFAYDFYQDRPGAFQRFFGPVSGKIISLALLLPLFAIVAVFYRLAPGDIPNRAIEILALGTGFLSMKGYVGLLGMILLLVLTASGTTVLPAGPGKIFGFKRLFMPFVEKIGKFSLCIYLFHQALMDVFFRTRLVDLGGPPYESFPVRLLAFAVTVLMSYALAVATDTFIESPYQKLHRENAVTS